MIVKVAIDLALDRLFDYEVPETLKEKLAVGQLLSVPFGHREARGFAVEVAGDGASGGTASLLKEKLKPVSAIVDETPFFSPALLTLIRKIAAYTAAPIESVLRAALPAAVLKKNARAREMLFVEPVIDRGGVPPILTTRQRWLLENIKRLDGGWLSQLCAELKTTPSSIRALAAKGLVAVAVRAKRRDPLAGRRILPTKPLALNPGQSAALAAIEALAKDDVDADVSAGGMPTGRAGVSPADREAPQLGREASQLGRAGVSPAHKEGLILPSERTRRHLC